MVKITADNVSNYGIGHNYTGAINDRDIGQIVYGTDVGEVTTTNPETPTGDTPYWKEYSYDRWWKVGPRAPE